ncbi:hypothetical protein HY485_01420 [Candidatus Woesearchaeota archaeon]|nr:hypothetical protein [Candidatus Woesearchaeota archaeon]
MSLESVTYDFDGVKIEAATDVVRHSRMYVVDLKVTPQGWSTVGCRSRLDIDKEVFIDPILPYVNHAADNALRIQLGKAFAKLVSDGYVTVKEV